LLMPLYTVEELVLRFHQNFVRRAMRLDGLFSWSFSMRVVSCTVYLGYTANVLTFSRYEFYYLVIVVVSVLPELLHLTSLLSPRKGERPYMEASMKVPDLRVSTA